MIRLFSSSVSSKFVLELFFFLWYFSWIFCLLEKIHIRFWVFCFVLFFLFLSPLKHLHQNSFFVLLSIQSQPPDFKSRSRDTKTMNQEPDRALMKNQCFALPNYSKWISKLRLHSSEAKRQLSDHDELYVHALKEDNTSLPIHSWNGYKIFEKTGSARNLSTCRLKMLKFLNVFKIYNCKLKVKY